MSVLIKDAQVCSSQHMQELKFDPINGGAGAVLGEITDGVVNLLSSFAGKPQNHMGDHRDAESMEMVPGIGEAGERVTAPDPAGSLFMNGLKAQLDPNRFAAFPLFQIKNADTGTVWNEQILKLVLIV